MNWPVGKGRFDPVPAKGEIGIIRWQGPDAVHVVRKDNPGIDGKGMSFANFLHHLTQNLSAFRMVKQESPAVGHHGEEKGPSLVCGPTVIRHTVYRMDVCSVFIVGGGHNSVPNRTGFIMFMIFYDL